MHAFLRILLFVLVGPAIGTLAMLLTTCAVSIARTGCPDDLLFLFSRWNDTLEIVAFGYVMGGAPALIAGVVASILPRFMATGWWYVGWVTLSGAIASTLVIFAFVVPSFSGMHAPSDWSNALSFMGMMAWIGGIAALGCTLLFGGLSRARTPMRVPA